MTETLRYGLIGKQDIRRGLGTFEVELADGRIVTISELDVALPTSTLSGLPAASHTAERLVRLTDSIRGVHRSTGFLWAPPLVLDVQDFITAGAGTSASPWTGWEDAVSVLTTGSIVLFAPGHYRHTSPITIASDNIVLASLIPNQRWRSANRPVRISYVGTDAAVKIAPGAGVGRESIQIRGLHWDGVGSSGAVNGLEMDGTAGDGAYVEGILIEDSTFADFPQYQVFADGTVFDITFRRFTAHNSGQAAEDLVRFNITSGGQSQLTFDDCFLLPYTAAKWAANFTGATSSIRFIGGTVAPQAGGAGANGISATAQLTLVGTHLEGSSSAHTATIGIRYIGSLGGLISPSFCAIFGTGVQIGDGTASQARGWTIAGNVGNNNVAAGGSDVLITAGGSRIGTILGTAFANGNPTITDNRFTTDGVAEVTQLENNAIQTGGNVSIRSVGKGLEIREGTNARMGTATLVAGAATVNTTAVTASSRIFVLSQTDGGTPGFLRVFTRVAGTSFTVNSSSGTDTSTFAWMIVEPAA